MYTVSEIAQESAFEAGCADQNGVSAGNEVTMASQQETTPEPGKRVFLVTAHHADDQIETILLKMVRYPETKRQACPVFDSSLILRYADTRASMHVPPPPSGM